MKVMDYIIVFLYFPVVTNLFLPIATFLSKHGKSQIYVHVYFVAAPNHNAQCVDNVMSRLY